MALAIVTAGAAFVRLVALSRPVEFVFDEIFYARNACRYVIGTAECGIEGLVSRAHPPLGNWMIGAGIKVFGYEAFGWRVAAALAGALTVALLYLLVRRLLRGAVTGPAATAGAFVAAALLAGDFLHLVHSRLAMLDAFVTLFVVAAVLFAVLDRDRERRPVWDRSPPGWLRGLALGRPWQLLAGASIGAAVAVKWSGAYIALAVIPLILAWELAARRRDARQPEAPPRPWGAVLRRTVLEELPRSLVLLGLVPVLVYLAAYLGRLPGDALGLPWQEGTFWRNIWEHQFAMLRFHASLEGSHPYESPPWSWPLLKRPVAYFFIDEGGAYREILAMGNPLVWSGGLIALVGSGIAWARSGWELRRPEPVLIGAVLATWLPWLILSSSRSQVFLWYALPTIPFLCAALGILAARIWPSRVGRVAVAALAAAALALFAFFFPLLTALPMEPDDWRSRMWLTDCQRPGAPTLVLPDDGIRIGPAPTGWCWI
ncbi:MAG TPA: phospholipid carrier-dependent glycosyltransferase [Candidatus Dormibacteraeota bacterium]|nr:phospholipid carrier-dependent glycosyltransferase [Candidatus Dormibacteraeota bacterium]